MHQVGAGVLGPVFRVYDPETDRHAALKAFPLDLTPEQAAAFAEQLQRLTTLGLDHPSLLPPQAAGVEGSTAYLVQEYFAADSIDTAIRQYGPAPVNDALRLVGHLAGALDFAAAAGVRHGALHPRDVLVAPRDVRMTGIGVAEALESVGVRVAPRRPYSAPERGEGREWDGRADTYSLAVIAYELLTGRRPTPAGESLRAETQSIAAAEPAALEEVFARAFTARPEDRYPAALSFAAALKHGLTGQPIEPVSESERPRRRAARTSGGAKKAASALAPAAPVADMASSEAPAATAVPMDAAERPMAGDATATDAPAASPLTDDSVPAPTDASLSTDESLSVPIAASPSTDEPRSVPTAASPSADDSVSASTDRLSLEDLDLRRSETPESFELSAFEAEAGEKPARRPSRSRGASADLPDPVAASPETEWDALPSPPPPAEPSASRRVPAAESSPRRVSGVALLVMLVLGMLLGLAAGYYFAVRPADDKAPSASSGEGTTSAPAPSQPVTSEEPVPAPGASTPAQSGAAGSGSLPPVDPAAGQGAPAGATTIAPGPATPTAATPAAAAPPAVTTPDPASGRAAARQDPASSRARSRARGMAAAQADRPRRQVFEGSLSIVSRPAGARVLVDGHPVGTTPMTLSKLSAGSHVVRLERDGYLPWSSAIQVVAGERNRVTASLDQRSSRSR